MSKSDPSGSLKTNTFFKEWLLISGILMGLLTIFFYDIVFLGKTLRVSNTLPTTLPSGQFNYPGGFPKYMAVFDNTPAVLEEPYQRFKEKSLSEGIFPLWNPHQAGGYPFLATLESSLLFLPEVILYALPAPYDWDIYYLFRLFIAGLFTYWFMRTLGFNRLPSTTAAVSYMFSGPILSFVTNVTLNTDILIPLLLLLIELMLRYNLKRYVLLTSFVIFQSVAGGHPEHTFFALLTGIIYLTFRIASKSYTYELKVVIMNFVISFVLGIGLSSVLLIPFAEYVFFQSWHVHSSNVGSAHEGLEKAITIMFPWYYSNELVTYKGWTYNTWPGGWIGFVPIWLTVFTFFAKKKNKVSYIFISLFSLYLLKIYGFILINWIGYLPIFNLIKFPLHISQSLAFAVAVLCGIALDYLCGNPENIKRLFISLIPIILIVFILLWEFPPSNSLWAVFGLPAGILLLLFLGMILYANLWISHTVFASFVAFLLLTELFFLIPRERSLRAEAFQEPPYVEFLKKDPTPFRVYGIGGSLFPNTATAFGLDDIGIYEGLFVKRFTDYIRELVDRSFFSEGSFHAFRSNVRNPANRFLDLLNLKYLILPRNVVINSEQISQFSLKLVYEGEVRIYERLKSFPRVMIRYQADVISDDKHALEILKNNYDIWTRVLLKRLPSNVILDRNLPPEDSSTVRIIDYNINHKIFMINMQHAGFLIVNDVNYPGWRVKVDEKISDLLAANYLFQAVYVPAGEHVIKFEFRPISFQIGLLASALSLMFLVLLIFACRYKKIQRQC